MKTDIVFGMLFTILNKKQTTAKYLAHKYQISIRTVYRYLSKLETSNIPIVTKSGRNGGISFLNTINLNNIFFTQQEKLTLLFLTQNIENQELKISLQTKLLALK